MLQLAAISTATWVDRTALLEEISKDPVLSQLRSTLDQGQGQQGGFTVNQGRLLYNGRLVIPHTSHVVEKLLHEYHHTALGGHNGEHKTYLRLAQDWYWEGMRRHVTQLVRTCQVCQQ